MLSKSAKLGTAIAIAALLITPISVGSAAHAEEYPSAGERYVGVIREECKLDENVVLYDKAADGSGSYLWVLPNPALGEKFNCAMRGARTYGIDFTLAPYGKWPAKEDIQSCYDQIDFTGLPGGQRTTCDAMNVSLQLARLDGVMINVFAEMDMLGIDKGFVEQAQLALTDYSNKMCAIASRTESAPSAESNGLHCMAKIISAHTDMILANPVELMIKDAMNSKEPEK
ncbi:MAG: hypothetical protein ABJP02_12565 [Parasphingorhabdus sp.]|uniref:hypothetical protein n=1 Tax=Parasphingorhabdus sp. TaxID=2709688 RepID=UPI00329A7013